MNSRPIIFDIETSPLPESELERLLPPFDAATVRGTSDLDREFDPEKVKLGNTKQEHLIAEKIEVARLKHAADQKAMVEKIEKAREEHAAKFQEKAALSPLTGKVLAIGYLSDGEPKIHGEDELRIITRFWDIVQECRGRGRLMIGHNIFGFDLPFLVRRSWLLGLIWPTDIFDGRFWGHCFVDTMEQWRLGIHGERVSLDMLAKGFNVGQKPEGIDGGDFAHLWESDRPTAEEYLRNDLKMTQAVAKKLGLILQEDTQ